MPVTRRRFVSTTASLAGSVAGLESLPATGAEPTPLETGLQAWVDTLFPEDEQSPAAGSLGVHLRIQKRASEIPEYEALLEKGMAWADSQAISLGKLRFAQLDEPDRVKIVAAAEASRQGSGTWLFFFHTLRDSTAFYYEHEESWSGVGFPHAPQPIGFPDHAEAPQK